MGNEQSSTALTAEELAQCDQRGRDNLLRIAEVEKRKIDEENRLRKKRADKVEAEAKAKAEADALRLKQHEAEVQHRRQQRAEEETRQRQNDKLLKMQEEALVEEARKEKQRTEQAIAATKLAVQKEKEKAEQAIAAQKEKAQQGIAAKKSAAQREKENAEQAAIAARAKKATQAEKQELAKREEAAKVKIAQMTKSKSNTAGPHKDKENALRQEFRQKFSKPGAVAGPSRKLSIRPNTGPSDDDRNDSPVDPPLADILAPWNPRKARQSDLSSEIRTAAVQPSSSVAGAKRPSSSGFEDERRASIQRIPKRAKTSASSSASPQSPAPITPVENDGVRQPPKWYQDLSVDKTRARNDSVTSATETILASLKEQIAKAKKSPNDSLLPSVFIQVQDKLHKLAFLKVDGQMLRNKLILSNQSGLPQIFDDHFCDGVDWPHDIQSDAEELYNKWRLQDFDVDILRGIGGRKPGQKGGDKIKDSFKKNPRVFGSNGLVNGQWWPTLICAVRDGAHGEMVAGICGSKEIGAYSCFLSGGGDNKYPDVDHGDVVEYCGTDDNDRTGTIQPGTQRLLESFALERPVRFIRCSKAQEKSKWAPSCGFRYDGLYDITDYKIDDKELQRHIFTLVRRKDQGPIRGGDGPESRPTKDEIKAYKDDKRLRGLDGKQS